MSVALPGAMRGPGWGRALVVSLLCAGTASAQGAAGALPPVEDGAAPAASASPPPSSPAPAQPPPGQPPPPPAGYGYPPQYPGYPSYPQQQEYPGYAAPAEPPPYKFYREGDPVPPGYHVEEKHSRGLLISGTIVLGVMYGLGVAIAGGDDFPNGSGWMLVPVVGPFITLSARDSGCDDGYCRDDDSGVRSALIFDGLGQVTGAILLAVGLATSTKRLARDDMVKVRVLPTRVGKSPGLGVVGVF